MTIAARHMLPLEIALALLSLPLAASILSMNSTIAMIVHALGPWGGLPQNAWWGGPIALIAFGLLCVSRLEWAEGRSWGDHRLRRWADLRCAFALLLAICHLSVAGLVVMGGHLYEVYSAALQAPIFVGLLMWCAFKTRRLSVALNPNIPTPGLDISIASEFGRRSPG